MSRGNAKFEVGQLVLTSSTPPGNLGLYAYDQELNGQNRSTLLGWLENIPGVEQP